MIIQICKQLSIPTMDKMQVQSNINTMQMRHRKHRYQKIIQSTIQVKIYTKDKQQVSRYLLPLVDAAPPQLNKW